MIIHHGWLDTVTLVQTGTSGGTGLTSGEVLAASYGELHSDSTERVPESIRVLIQRINDYGYWSSDQARTEWMIPRLRRLLDAELPVPTLEMEQRIAFAMADVAVRQIAPDALDRDGKKSLAAKLRACAPIVDRETALAGRAAADAAAYAYADAYAAKRLEKYLYYADILLTRAIEAAQSDTVSPAIDRKV